MKINEIYYSIQGEGNWAGYPNIFIRTSGCNLRCSYCDTKYAYNDYTEFNIENIIENISQYKCNKICITGGEPLLQNDVNLLIDNLIKKKYEISIETNGSYCIKSFFNKKYIMISLDIKCPSSNMNKKMLYKNLNFLQNKDQIKFVIKDYTDYKFSKDIIKKYKIRCPIYFQPVWGTNLKKLADWILNDNLNVKLSIQIHKIIWANKRGV
jgi:7-carboxy-7-deazaguanine synthase